MLAIRALVKDQELDVDEVAGVPVEYLQELVDAMIGCQFGVIFFGMGLTQSAGKFRNVDVAISLIRDLNMRTKFAIMPMRGHFNVTGANTVLTWQSGYPYAVDFSLGYPRYNPGETTVVDILLRKESDAALVIASDPASNFPYRDRSSHERHSTGRRCGLSIGGRRHRKSRYRLPHGSCPASPQKSS
jgi:formylmethanofuran dehydrogenase subunit B